MQKVVADLSRELDDLRLLVKVQEAAKPIQTTVAPPPVRTKPTWTDAYGSTRTAAQMTSEHLWNVMGYVRDREKVLYGSASNRFPSASSFYWEAKRELERRGWL